LSGAVRRALMRLPHVVWLTAPADVLWRRVSAEDAPARPLARDQADFERLLAEREPLYVEVATVVVDTTGTRPADLAADVVGLIARTVPDRLARKPGGGGAG
jgi:shikimate kinase